MPIYEYHCSKCGDEREEIRPYSDRDMFPRCRNGHRMHRLASMPYVRPESMYADHEIFGRVVKNDYDSPWEGTGVEPNDNMKPVDYKQKKIQVDYGSSTNVGANH